MESGRLVEGRYIRASADGKRKTLMDRGRPPRLAPAATRADGMISMKAADLGQREG